MNDATRWWIAGAVLGLCLVFGILIDTRMEDTASAADSSARASVEEATTRDDAAVGPDAIRAQLQDAGYIEVPENVVMTLSTLEKIHDYPVYTMRYSGPYLRASELQTVPDADGEAVLIESDWACSLFAAVGEAAQATLGRNFDWEYSPLLVLFLEPEDGYRSVMSIDIAYLIDEAVIAGLDSAAAEDLLPLLSAPFLTFDGMNEMGVAIGMASVDYDCGYPRDADKRDVGDLRLMREVLEASASVDEALAFLEGINPVSQGGPNTHYLVADPASAALVEYHDGEMVVFRSGEETPWQLGTNFPVCRTDGDPLGHCWRYDQIEATLRERDGVLSVAEAADLLQTVSTTMTQWSIVYDLAALEMHLIVERDAERALTFSLKEDAE